MKTRIAIAALVTGGIVGGAVAAHALTGMPAVPFAERAGITEADGERWGGRGHHGFRGGMMGPGGGMMGTRSGMMQMMREVDADDDGAITQEEVDAFIMDKRAAADANGDGDLTLAEFEAVWLSVTRPRMVDAFQALDEDGDALVTSAEVNERFGDVVARLDRNEDGRLDRADRGRFRHGRGYGNRGERDDD